MWKTCATGNLSAVLMASLLLAAPAIAQERKGASGVGVPEDLLSVLALRGKPCAKVVQHERRGDNDYLVRCESGHRYRVYVNAEGRVVVEDR
jgi:hypothetical protein